MIVSKSFVVPFRVVDTRLYRIEVIDLYAQASLTNPIHTTLSQLAARWDCSKSQVLRVIDKCEANGLLTRNKNGTAETVITMLDVAANGDESVKPGTITEHPGNEDGTIAERLRNDNGTEQPVITSLNYSAIENDTPESGTKAERSENDNGTKAERCGKKAGRGKKERERKESTKEKKEKERILTTIIPTKSERLGEPPQSEDASKNPLPSKLVAYFESQGKEEFAINVWLTRREHERLLSLYGDDLLEFLYGQMSSWSVSFYPGSKGVGWKTYRLHTNHYQTIENLAPRWAARYEARRRLVS